MGNCQAIDAAALVIQHPSGKIERLYWPISASEVMRLNPGHYVSLIIPLPVSEEDQNNEHDKKTVRFTRVKLLRPNETLTLGHAYRLVTTQGMNLVVCILFLMFILLGRLFEVPFFSGCRGCEGFTGEKVCKIKETAAGNSREVGDRDGDGSC